MAEPIDVSGAMDAYLNTPARLGAQARMTMNDAVSAKPDYEAELRSVAQKTGVPVDTVRSYPDEMKKQATLGAYDFDRMGEQFPNTAKFLGDPDKAAVGHDESGFLSTLEQAAKYFVSAPGKSSTLGGDIKAAYFNANSGAAGALGAVARTFGAPLDFLENFPSVGGNPMRRLSEGFLKIADEDAAKAKLETGKSSTWLGGAVSSGVQSLAQNAPMMLGAFLPGGQMATLTGMGAMTGGQTYQKDIADGTSPNMALLHGLSDAVIEVGTEMGPLSGLIHEMKAGTPLMTSIVKNAIAENKGEQVATALQDLNDWAVNDVNKGKTFVDYLKARPEAAAQTAIATLIGAGGNVAIMQSVQGTADRLAGYERNAQVADQHANVLEVMQRTIEASKLLERSPDTLRSYMQDLADQGVPNVFVDSAALVKAGVDMQALAQAVPSVAAQMEQIETGGDLVIPTGELLVNTAGSEFSQALMDHARTSEDAMSREEAKVFMQEKGDLLNAEIDRVLTEKANDTEFKAGRDEMQANLKAELDSIKRFTPAVNEQYAALTANFYAVMAARAGMTVQDFANTYKLGFAGQAGVGNQVLDQGLKYPTAPRSEWYGEGTYEADGGVMRIVSPDEYLAKVRPLTMDAESRENIDLLKEHIQSGKTLDPLLIRADGKEDGRHRAMAAKELGIAQVPVIDYGNNFEGTSQNTLQQPALPKKQTATSAVEVREGAPLTGDQRMDIHQVGAYFDKIAGGAKDINNPKDFAKALKMLVAELKFQMESQKSGMNWYDEEVKSSFEITQQIIPELADESKRQLFSIFAGLQSPGTNARDNWVVAAEAFQHYLATGTVPGRNPKNGQLWMGGPVSANKEKALNFLNNIVQDLGEAGAVKWAMSDHTVKELNEARKTWGNMGPGVSGKAADKLMGLFAFGPKVGPFVMNINGIHELTIDVWATRSFNRYFGQMVGPDGKITDAPTEPQRRVAKDLFNAAATELGIKPYQVQSAIWFFEQQLFNTLGTGSASYSFSDGARKFAGANGGVDTGSAGGVQTDVGATQTAKGAEVNGQRYQQTGNGSGRPAVGGLAPLAGAPSVPGFHGPDPRIVSVAEQYAAANGIDLKRQDAYVNVDPERAARIAQAYTDMVHAPNDPAVKEAYAELIKQTTAQYQALADAGYKFHFIDLESASGQAYASTPWNAMRDTRANQQMGVFSTEAGFGTDADFSPEANPLLADTGLMWPLGTEGGAMQRVLANDLFRAVHDAFGHGIEGAGFRAQGEENAWQAHSRLFTGSALGAITTETRGQNSWLNYGPYGESNRTANVEDTKFADQKTGLMPEWTWTEGRAGDQANVMEQPARGQIAFGDDITQQASIISIFKNADLSTFIHESGHFFLEVQADLAARIEARITQGETVSPGERSILDDMNTTLAWMGVEGSPGQSAIGAWLAMPIEEKRPMHEKWARGFEAYAFEGKAPSLDLQKTFQTFRAWLVNVYRSLLKSVNASKTDIADAMKVELSPEVRSVMDRMLATSNQIAEAEAARDMGPLFKTAEEAGMTAEEYKAYHDQGVQATMDAVDDLQAKGLKDMQWLQNARSRKLKELQKQHDALRREITMQVRGEVMGQSIYRAWTFLTAQPAKPNEPSQTKVDADKEIAEHKQRRVEAEKAAATAEREKLYAANPDVKGLQKGQLVAKNKRQTGINVEQAMLEWDKANPVPEKVAEREEPTDPMFATGKLNTEDLRKAYGKKDDAVWRKLSALRMTSEENGVNPDIVAELFGFSSGDELVQKLAQTEPPKSVIEGMTDQRMLEENGDLATPAGLERAADAAIHNDARARFVATELAALQKAMSVREKVPGKRNTVDVLARAARDYADAIIAKLKVRDVRPSQYAAAEARNAKAAAKAIGDVAQATMHKRNQLINMYAAKAAYAARDDVAAAVAYFRKFDKPSTTIDPEYSDQIHALLERFDLRQGTSLKAIDKRASLVEWVQSQVDQGLEPDIPPALLQEANRKSFKEMTVEEIRGLRDTIKQIEHLGRLKNKLLTSQANRNFAAVVDEITASLELHAGDRQANTRTPNTLPALALIKLKNFWASHIKAATWARVMDGGKDGGPVWEYLIRTANMSGDREVVMKEKATKELAALVAPVLKEGKMGGKGIYYAEIGQSLNKEARLAVALNLGNASNQQRLLGGEGWTIEQLQPVLKSLTAADWKFVQSVWDHFESYRPEIGAKEKRIYGREPTWIEAVPVQTDFGVLRGGYYPVKYDPRASERAESHAEAEDAKRMLAGAYTSATTRRSFTKARVEEVNGRPLLLSLDGIYNGVQEVIHDLTWHEWLIDANKLVKNKKISGIMREKYGPDVHQQFKRWLEDNATGDRGAADAGEMAASWVRQGVSVSGLGLNVMSALMQPLGLTQSIVRIGPKWVGKGLLKMIGAPLDTTDEVNGKSEFMRTRSLTQLREIAEVRSQVKGRSKTREAVDSTAYFLMMRAQQLVDVPTWWGAYEKAIAGGNDESRAVALSDQAVIDSQGSGGTKDQSAIERGGPYLKLFTTFYSFFNTALNLGVQSTMTEKNKAKLAANYLMLYSVPAVLGMALKDAMTAGDSGDWDDPEKLIKKLIGEQLSFLFGLMVGVREMGGAAQALTGTAQYGTDYSGPAGLRFLADSVKLAKQANQGEMDDGLRKAVINTAGELLRLPSAQINRTITGIQALNEGKTQNPGALLTGYQEPR